MRSGNRKARAWGVAFRASLLERFKSPRRLTQLRRDLFPPLHLCLRLRSLIDGVCHSCGKAIIPCHVDGDPHARADSHFEAAAGACVRAVSAAQNQVQSQNPLRQLRPGLRAVRASHARPAPAAPQVSRARAVGAPSALRGPASPEQYKVRASAHTCRRARVSQRGRQRL